MYLRFRSGSCGARRRHRRFSRQSPVDGLRRNRTKNRPAGGTVIIPATCAVSWVER